MSFSHIFNKYGNHNGTHVAIVSTKPNFIYSVYECSVQYLCGLIKHFMKSFTNLEVLETQSNFDDARNPQLIFTISFLWFYSKSSLNLKFYISCNVCDCRHNLSKHVYFQHCSLKCPPILNRGEYKWFSCCVCGLITNLVTILRNVCKVVMFVIFAKI